ncbi:glycosyltransferase family 2 protein [Mycobacterium sp.]|uniref:glycosyltransferase family 2 protein n=1 Tax=Mycobacterium sp. TaxID=1785 RepID=UPI0031E3AA16
MIEALGISMVKNEVDVIEAFVRHNLQFMDAMVMIDNDSADATREIIVMLQQEGLPLILFDDPVVAHFQAEIVTVVYRKVVPKFKPRFVFLLDADEFIVAPSRETLYLQLRTMRPGTQAQYRWRTYIPAPTGAAADTTDPLRSITHRRAVEETWWKTIIATKPKIDMKLKIQQGNHDVKFAGRSLRRLSLRNVALAHFPVRSVDQITGKVLVGWIANMERNRYAPDGGYAFQWKGLYERITRGTGLTPEDLTLEALKYGQSSPTQSRWPQDVVCDPVLPAYATLALRPKTDSTALQKVLKSVDKIFNPDAALSGHEKAIALLHDANRKRTIWRDFLWPSTSGRHRRRERYIDLPPFRHLADRHRPVAVLGIGSESAPYLKYFASLGAERTMVVDPVEGRSGHLRRGDYTSGGLGELVESAETFDLVVCVAAANHPLAQSERVLVDNVVRHADQRIVFCGTPPPERRAHNTHVRPLSLWLDLFASVGWYPRLFDSLALQSLSTFPWLRGSLVVLTRDDRGAAAAHDRLTELEQERINWNKARPEVITHPFTETVRTLFPSWKTRWIRRALRK